MMSEFLRKWFGYSSRFDLKQAWRMVARINQLESSYVALPEDALREKTRAWRASLAAAEDLAAVEERLNEILPEAFAVVKNACRRLCDRTLEVRGQTLTWDMIPFDVQLIGGMVLHSRRIAEMATGEGKTLVATLPAYLSALTGRGVHIVTVNDYLAARDSEWMGAVFRLLGLSVGCIQQGQPPTTRRQMYACDITYGTNSEFGFDYLRDNGLAQRAEEQVQRGRFLAIIDEVDSILIDEARTPLIISGPAPARGDRSLYAQYQPAIQSLVHQQTRLCEGYVREAREILARLGSEGSGAAAAEAALERRLGLVLYTVRLGAPRSAGLLELLEDPRARRRLNRAELALHGDGSKQALYRQKEELFYGVEEKSREADLTEKGRRFLAPGDPEVFVLPDLSAAFAALDQDPRLSASERAERKTRRQEEADAKAQRIHVISSLLKAHCLYERDVNYVVQEGKVVIVDEHTGRPMPGRRWADGLHEAVEAKERVEIERETQTYATITIQNYFRLYPKLAGMTGTAETEAGEFLDLYRLGVTAIPTHKPVARRDANDSVFKTKREKFAAVLREIQLVHGQGRPVLVGTTSVETSEHLSGLLDRAGIAHTVLNAKRHQQEAEIVARAGRRGAVTIATNMAGRGTDIKLGEGVPELGGLHVLATERHDARRIDRQLRGRCARQGDPGTSHCFLSLEDDLVRLYGSDGLPRAILKGGREEGRELQHPLLRRWIEATQRRVEQHHFQARKRTLEYDDVMNQQREAIYGLRNEIVLGEDIQPRLLEAMRQAVAQKLNVFSQSEAEPSEWDLRGFLDWLLRTFPVAFTEAELREAADRTDTSAAADPVREGMSAAQSAVADWVYQRVNEAYTQKSGYENPDGLKSLERFVLLSAIDRHWQEHLSFMEGLREAINLRAYAQRDPLLEYQAEAVRAFDSLMAEIRAEVCHRMFRSASSLVAFERFLKSLPQSPGAVRANASATHRPGVDDAESEPVARPQPARRFQVGRNDACPCGSGKKFKRCCGG